MRHNTFVLSKLQRKKIKENKRLSLFLSPVAFFFGRGKKKKIASVTSQACQRKVPSSLKAASVTFKNCLKL
jgi:hypothetical protein